MAIDWLHECNEVYSLILEEDGHESDDVNDDRWSEINGNCTAAMDEVDRMIGGE